MFSTKKYSAALVVAMLLVLPRIASACTACNFDSNSPLTWGMNAGIWTLLGVIMSVLAGVVLFFVHVGRRSAETPVEPHTESKTEKN